MMDSGGSAARTRATHAKIDRQWTIATYPSFPEEQDMNTKIISALSRAIRCALLAAGALAIAAPVLAAEPAGGGQDRGDAAVGDEVTELGSVVVTAQSRSQEMQKVPITMQVVDADAITAHAATDLSRMDIFIPGLTIDASQATQPGFELRGIGDSGFGLGADPAVGVYVDGVYSARSGASLLAFNDVQRIEVLKGPQGTLFGRNAAAGAISIVTNRPGYDLEARARVRAGNYNTWHTDALLNLPAGENMAFRLNLVDRQSNGWVRDGATGRHYAKDGDWGSRLGWRWDLGVDTQLLLTWEHEKLNQPPRAAFGLAPMSSDRSEPAPYPPVPSTFRDPLHAVLLNDAVDGRETRNYDSYTLSLEHYFDWGSLTSTTSYRDFDTVNRGDFDGTNHIATYFDTANIESNRAIYQEFKFAGEAGPLDWVAGTSWYSENARQRSETNLFTTSLDTLLRNLGVPTGTPDGTLFGFFDQVLAANGLPWRLSGNPWGEAIDNHLKYKSAAIYGDLIWHLGERYDLTVGARYTRDDKRFTWYNVPRIAPELDATVDALAAAGILDMFGVDPGVFRQNIVFGDAVGLPVQQRNRWTDFSPRAVLDVNFNDDVMGYVSVAKGYKAGGYDSVQVGSRFSPEKVWNYEAGIKANFPAARMLLNGSVYHYRYTGLQSLTLDPNTDGSGVPRYVADSSDQKADGAELQFAWQPLDALRVSGDVAYINARYGDKLAVSGVDISGQPVGTPRLSSALGLQYVWQLGGAQLQLNVDHAWRGRSRCNEDSILQGLCAVSPNFDSGAAQRRTDARLAWTSATGRVGLAAWVNNLSDNQWVQGVNNITASVFGTPFAYISPPRMYGIEFQLQY